MKNKIHIACLFLICISCNELNKNNVQNKSVEKTVSAQVENDSLSHCSEESDEEIYSQITDKNTFRDLDKAFERPLEVYQLSLHDTDTITSEMRFNLFKNLKIVNMGGCHFVSFPCDLSSLSIVYLSITSSTFQNNELPDCIGNMKCLRTLYVRNCKIDKIPENIGNLPNLKMCGFPTNNLEYFPNTFDRLCLQSFSVDENPLKQLPKLTIDSLRSFSVSHCDSMHKDLILSIVSQMNLLEGLSLTYIDFSKNNIKLINKGLKSLRMDDCQLSQLPDLSNCNQLSDLSFRNNKINQVSSYIWSMDSLESIILQNNSIYRISDLNFNWENISKKLNVIELYENDFESGERESVEEFVNKAREKNVSVLHPNVDGELFEWWAR